MNTLNIKHILSIGLLVMVSQQAAVAGDWHGSRQSDYRHEDRHYNSGHVVTPPPRGYSRVYANAGEYYYANGLFYRPSRHGYVAVAAPPGAVVNHLPRFYRVSYRRGQPYYVADNTIYRRHANGYVVVEAPGLGYRR